MGNRTRVRGNLTTSGSCSAFSVWTTCSETAWTNRTGNLTCMKTGRRETMSDVVVPGYHRRVQNGEVFFNGMYREVLQSDTYGGQGHQIRATGIGNCGGQNVQAEWRFDGDWFARLVSGPSNTAPIVKVISDSTINQMKREVTAAVLNARGRADFNVSESLAERQKSLSMLADLLRRANPNQVLNPRNRARLVGHLKATVKSPRRVAKIIADDWLMYRYGIQPLVKDIQSVMKAIRDPSAKEKPVRHTSRKSLTLTSKSTTQHVVSSDACDTSYSKVSEDTVVVRAMSLDEFFNSVSRDFGFSAKDLLTLPWELVPYSFVADWFTNIGDILGAIAPTPGWKQLGSCLVLKRMVVTNTLCGSSTVLPSTGYTMLRPRSGGLYGSLYSVQRMDLDDSYLIPVIRSDFRMDEWRRVADSAALVGQLILRRFAGKST